jgi:hypothetical protein
LLTLYQAEVNEDANGELDDLEYFVAKASSGRTDEELKDESKAMRDIRNQTSMCKRKHLHEPS